MVDIFEGNVNYYKNDPHLYTAIGIYYLEDNNLDKAELYLRMAVELGYDGAFYALGSVYYHRNDIKNSITYFKLAADNGLVGAAYDLAGILYDEGDLGESLKYNIMVLDTFSNFHNVKNILVDLGLTKEHIKRLAELK